MLHQPEAAPCDQLESLSEACDFEVQTFYDQNFSADHQDSRGQEKQMNWVVEWLNLQAQSPQNKTRDSF